MRGLLLITVVAALALAGSAGAQNPTLFGTVGPGFSIRVVDGAGNRVTRIPPGTYTVQVNDLATEHNFHLSGPAGFDMSTTVEGTGSATWTVTFQAGTYHYQCDPHFNMMKGDITVENGAPLPAPAPPPPTTTNHEHAATSGSAAAAAGPEADRLGRPGRDDQPALQRTQGDHPEGGPGLDHDRRPVGEGQLPAQGPRRQPRHLEARPRRGHLAGDAEARPLRVQLGRDPDAQGRVPRHLAPPAPLQLRVQLCADQQRDGRVVQPEQ